MLYTSKFCSHAWLVENFIVENGIPAQIIRVDKDSGAREELLQINNGFASVPTLIFADGTKLIEPLLQLVKEKLGLAKPGLMKHLRRTLGSE